ncbi:mycofactocin-coupled SDR family oxidoreductase [Mycobacterium branderi]|uniref:3-ketoacyl-ACP reductase n=1 Tax=Mycobacterium branderi TaxID=43348 RepID=A0A7I7WHR8_9MYCO|nr:mycofactocin-coupled SDR family oxidoreductase [Mycobacterium branderi]MCV7234637.1 mycofactocin-coupled SDR family oxidoreductase [Mycobacterium branderi]ORA33173.1 3-ketoacyl-ACP reductase [Mycobacterium branderi]BBZ15428.1 oxidoreductase [Mycobacterium branderi]
MAGRVEGKVALITGAGRGQGRSHAVRLAAEGADIIAIDICQPIADIPVSSSAPATAENLAETARMVKALNRRIVTAEVDVRDFSALKSAVDDGVSQLGGLDVIVANAGIADAGVFCYDLDENTWQTMLDINLTGVWKTVKASVGQMISAGKGGSIVLTSSVAGLTAYPNMCHYVAAKHGVVGLMRTFAVELGQHMIRVNSVSPTHVSTPMLMNERTFRLLRPDLANPGADDIIPVCETFHIMPRPWVEAEDITNAVLFFASDESRYITGVALPVDLGHCLK